MMSQRVQLVKLFLTFIMCGCFSSGVYGQCSLPTMLQNTVWIDSDKGELMFDTTNMTGWDLDYDGNAGDPLEHWQCFYTETDGSKLYLVFQLSQTIVILQDEFNVFMCMELTQVTDYSFYYYLLWSAEPPAFNYDRISGQDVNTTITDPRNQVCLDASNPAHAAVYPNIEEYHVLIKQDSVAAATQECPDSYFGVYTYTITDMDSTVVSCGNTYDKLDVCTDYTKMAFNNSLCNTTIAYTENGSLACMVSLTSGDYTYHTAYNLDATVDDVSTFRFTCFVSSLASDGSLQVSQTMGSCKKDQTPDSQPVLPNGTVAGLNIQFTPNRLCPKIDESEESGGLSTGAIIGITFGVILFIVTIIVLVCICIRCRQPSKKQEKEKIEEKSTVHTPREDSPDISTMMHQRSQVWKNGFPGEPPNDTKYCGDNKISKSPDDQFNPFSVPPLSNGKAKEDGWMATTPTKFTKNQTQSPGPTTPTEIYQATSVLSRTAHHIKPDNKIVILKKDKNDDMPLMLDNASHKSKQSVSRSPSPKIYSTSSNANIIPICIQQKANFNENKTCQDNNRHLAQSEQITENKAVKNIETKTQNEFSNVADNQILTSTQGVIGYMIKTSQNSEGQTLEETIDKKHFEKVAQNANTVFSNETGKHTLTSAHRAHGSKIMVMTPVAIHTEPSTTETNNESNTDTRLRQTNGPKRQQSERDNAEILIKQNRQTVISVNEPSQLENNPPKHKHRKSFSKTNKTNSNHNRKKSNGQLASNQTPKRRGHDALVGSKSVSLHRRTNKRGTFYNAITTAEPKSYLQLTELNETVYSDTGIYYDEDNERERALVKPRDSEQLALPQLQYGITDLFLNETPSENLRASVNSELSLSRISHITLASSRLSDTPTSNIDSRGVQYFIDNETNSIVISVKSADIPEEAVDDVENKDTLTEDVEDDVEYEEENVEEFDVNTENRNKLEDVHTAMTVQYGDDEEDPDRMILGSYGPDLLTIKE